MPKSAAAVVQPKAHENVLSAHSEPVGPSATLVKLACSLLGSAMGGDFL